MQRVAYAATRLHGICTPVSIGGVTQPPEVLAVGETMVLVAPALAESLETAIDFHLDPGGAEANVASHLAALGRRAAWAGLVGDDALGRRLVAQLAARGVDTTWVDADAEAPTGVYVKDPGRGVRYYRRGSAASRMDRAFAARLPIAGSRLLHLSGITPALSATCDALRRHALRHGPRRRRPRQLRREPSARALAVDGCRGAAACARSPLEPTSSSSASTRRQALWGAETADDVRGAAARRAASRREGRRDRRDRIRRRRRASTSRRLVAEVVEPVGAGDAFAAGYLDAWLDGASPADRLRAGHERAVLVLGDTADFPRPRRED